MFFLRRREGSKETLLLICGDNFPSPVSVSSDVRAKCQDFLMHLMVSEHTKSLFPVSGPKRIKQLIAVFFVKKCSSNESKGRFTEASGEKAS